MPREAAPSLRLRKRRKDARTSRQLAYPRNGMLDVLDYPKADRADTIAPEHDSIDLTELDASRARD